MKGKIIAKDLLKKTKIRIGFSDVGAINPSEKKTIWDNQGEIIVKGRVELGAGSRISNKGSLVFGNGVHFTANADIICHKKIVFGDGALVSWDCLFMDTDFHKIYSLDDVYKNEQLNQNDSILVGQNVWIGCRCTILKGSNISKNSIISAGAIICKQYEEKNIIIGGLGKILKKNISWNF